MGHKGKITVPNYSSDNGSANKFSDMFTRKTAGVRDIIINSGSSMGDTTMMSDDVKSEGQHLTYCRHATQDEVIDIIMNSPAKSCEHDLLPANLLKKVLECLLPLIITIINKSLVDFHVPTYFKKAHVR